MAINYTTLVGAKTLEGSLKNWANSNTIPSVTILTLAEALLYEMLRIREMRARTTGAMSTTLQTISLPADFRHPRSLWITGIDKAEIRQRTPENVEEGTVYDSAGAVESEKPRFYWTDENTIYLDALPFKAYPYALIYYKALAALGTSNETNVLTNKYPLLLITACQYIAYAQFLRNEKERNYHKDLLGELVRDANRESDMSTAADLDLPIVAE